MNFRKAEQQGVITQFDHGPSPSSWGLPVAVTYLAYYSEDGSVRQIFQLSDQVSKQLWPGSDDRLQVLGDLTSHGQEQVGVLAEFLGQEADLFLGRWGEVTALNLAQIGGLYANALGHLADRVTSVLTAEAFPPLTDVGCEGHVYSI